MKRSKLLFFLFWVVVGNLTYAQQNYYFVAFKDKEGNGFTNTNPQLYLSARAIARREKQNISVVEQDQPVASTYLSQVASVGVQVFESSKWFNGVLIKSTQQLAEQVKLMNFVADVNYVAPQDYAGRKSSIQNKLDATGAPSDTLFQNKILQVDEMHQLGYFGKNVWVAVFDGGFINVNTLSTFSTLFKENRVVYAYNFIEKSDNVYQYSTHGTRVLSTIAANELNYQGIVSDSEYLLFVTENVPSEYRIEEYYWLIAAERADSAGVDVINSSLGYSTFDDPVMNYTPEDMDGSTTVVTRAAQIASEKGMVLVNSAGNSGGSSTWEIIAAPADATNVVSVGSINSNYQKSSFSSVGPSADGRIKPDVVALGASAYLINAQGNITSGSGTSFASPQVAGLLAGVWQAFPEIPAVQLINAARMSASNAAAPDNDTGYGIPGFRAIKNYIEAQISAEPVQVYPNPVENDLVQLNFTNPFKTNSATVTLYNTMGQPINNQDYSITWSENKAELDLSTFTAGVYILKITFIGNESTQPFVTRLLKY